MSIKETRVQFESLVGELKANRRRSALIFSGSLYEKYKKYCNVIPFILEALSIVPLATKLLNNDDGGFIFAGATMIIIGYCQTYVKIMYILLNIDGIDEIFEWIQELHREHENELISRIYAERLRKFLKVVKFITRIITISYGSGAVFGSIHLMTVQPYFKVPFVNKSYEFVHRLVGPFTLIYNAYNIYTADSIIIFIGIYFIAALGILSDIIGLLNESSNTPSTGYFLPKIISFHIEILKNFVDFCEMFKFLIFYQLINGTGFILFNLYLIGESENYFFFWVSFICVFAQFALFCLFGQIIFNKSERIFTDLYQTKWYEMEVKDQKALLLMMKMSQNEFGLKAAGMYDINLILFINVFKLCFSWYAVLYAALN
uniref:Odorant receptor n=1 Tax=Lutzomyia longipalpis TaxID=7200 RepID=A0A240SXY6_LUTLO